MRERQGCLGGLFQLFALTAATDWLQKRYGFGRGCSCTGIGCGFIILILFIVFACSIVGGTDWTRLSVGWPF